MKGVHFLLSYRCTQTCDHCFVFSSPEAPGTFSLARMREALGQASNTPGVGMVYFEGGEPFLFYPLLVESIALARKLGLKVGIVTNGFFATTREDAKLWLEPLRRLGLEDLSISDDEIHCGPGQETPASRAAEAAREMGMPVLVMRCDKPKLSRDEKSIASSGVMFRGRAAEKMLAGMPDRPASTMTGCPGEKLDSPGRVHVDAYGNVHLCQGLLMGNILKRPLPELVAAYDVGSHPVAGPLFAGGPLGLAREYRTGVSGRYVSECHFCYVVRKALLGKFPDYLGPKQVYGL